ncbi:carboxylesteras-like protein [Lentithecium fluviatile CBS 122367]|uniref:Carboxylic ester hydrolase n=1 Tax=Lentithecium fluviatile CBS 122367 TaxID=1168545 RepID=A0A6G1J6F5_9PLEO|nr:carboxylesteras-like protein [Lentithecium fluviatile CBS 122367]
MMTTIIKTPFGEFKGKNGDGVVQYLGVRYASLKDQLSVPEMVEDYGVDAIDATGYGPRAPSMDGCEFEQNILIQQSIGAPATPPMSGTKCLNLNITVPDTKTGKPLPVLVFIHGGGFLMGGNHWPQYDPARIVKLSAELQMHVIAVNINYRLGVLGNLTSEELREAGYPGNNSLRDQKCALQWISAHIGGFGGDSGNVTVFGESAGAVAVFDQLYSQEPLFKRAISMSGTPIILKPLPKPVTEMAYGNIMKALDLGGASVEERIEKLTKISPEDLVVATPMTEPLIPFLDGDIIPVRTSFKGLTRDAKELEAEVPGRQWCKDLMIGDCQHDGNVLLFMGLAERKPGIASALHASFAKILGASLSEAVLQAYGITSTTGDDAAMQSIIDLATDIAYYAPALSFARSWPGKTYYYQFNEPNPWDGVFKGSSTHMLDAAFLFRNFEEKMGERERGVGLALAKDFIKFANEVKPWDEYDVAKGNVKVFGPSKERTSDVVEDNGWGHGRRDALFRLQEAGKVDLDALSGAWDSFVANM